MPARVLRAVVHGRFSGRVGDELRAVDVTVVYEQSVFG